MKCGSKKMAKGGKAKMGYKTGGMMEKPKAKAKPKVDVGGMMAMKKGGKTMKMKSGGQCRGKGAAKRGYGTSKKMG